MSARFHILALILTALVVAAGPTGAQSLGDIGREEEARRKEIKRPAKVYTNKDLASVPPATPASDDASKTAASAETGSKEADKSGGEAKGPEGKSADAKTTDAKSKDKEPARGQAYWAGRMKDLTTQLSRDQAFESALQSQINGLTADFTARDDPAQRELIARDRQKALEELDRVRKAIQTEKKAVADLEEEARRAAVPPGWLR